MAKWGNVEFGELKDLQKRIEKLMRERDKFCRECASEIAQRLLRKVVKRTPTGVYETVTYTKKDGTTLTYNEGKTGGTLKRSWAVTSIEKKGDTYVIDVINPSLYASYVEFGHRQTPGRFVPQIGKKLKNGWVEGQFMLTISEKEIQSMAPAMIEKKLQKRLEEMLNG